MTIRVNAKGGDTGKMLGPELLPGGNGKKMGALRRRRADQHGLGQRWTLVRRMRLISDHHDRLLETFLAQRFRRPPACLSAADNDEGVAGGHGASRLPQPL